MQSMTKPELVPEPQIEARIVQLACLHGQLAALADAVQGRADCLLGPEPPCPVAVGDTENPDTVIGRLDDACATLARHLDKLDAEVNRLRGAIG